MSYFNRYLLGGYVAAAVPGDCTTDSDVFVTEFNFGKPRGRVIDKTVNKALEILHKEILKNS